MLENHDGKPRNTETLSSHLISSQNKSQDYFMREFKKSTSKNTKFILPNIQ